MNFFRHNKATTKDPTKVADQYNHRSAIDPDTSAGANDLAGFIDAPEMKEKKKISSPTMPPIAIPPHPLKPFV